MGNDRTKHPAAVELGRLGGRASAKVATEAKRAASRANGKLGGAGKHKRRREADETNETTPKTGGEI